MEGSESMQPLQLCDVFLKMESNKFEHFPAVCLFPSVPVETLLCWKTQPEHIVHMCIPRSIANFYS